ncbi:MAG: serine/threonine-protein phosphatase, partial [Streptomycetaceae bacterium]|nr:serine/threonine-protein phosphatase [Streptomycetaceae bacterium]
VPDLAALAEHMERRLVRESAAVGDAELFVTALLLEFPPDRAEVRVVDRGHPGPILIRHGRATKMPTRPGVPLGLGALAAVPDEPTAATTHPLAPGDVLVLHTDGVSEARGADGAFYPTEERLSLRFGGRTRIEPATVAAFLRDDLADYADGTGADDIAVLALSRTDRSADQVY